MAEQRASAAIVGVEEVEFLDHPDGMLHEGLELRRDIAAAIRRHRPEVVVTVNHRETYGGRYLNMADHRVPGRPRSTRCATPPTAGCSPTSTDAGLEPWAASATWR